MMNNSEIHVILYHKCKEHSAVLCNITINGFILKRCKSTNKKHYTF